MLNRVLIVVVLVPLAVILIALAVANRMPVAFTLDPFNPGNPGLTLQLPLFVMLFLALGLGLILGSFATWWKQGRYRKEARNKSREVQSLIQEIGQRKPAPEAFLHVVRRMGCAPGQVLFFDDLQENVDGAAACGLQAVLFRAAVFCDGDALTAQDFPQLSEMIGDMAEASQPVMESAGVQIYTGDGNLRPLEDIEADVIRLAIGHYRGRMTEVARRLGIGRSTLYRKLSDLGIESAA